MSALQWALLIFGIIAVIVVYLASRRPRIAANGPRRDADATAAPVVPNPQMDIFAGSAGFDEFGVGRVRRIEPNIGEASEDYDPPMPGGRTAPEISSTALIGEPPSARASPSMSGKTLDKSAGAAAQKPADASQDKPADKIVSLLIAERSSLPIFGEQLHAALRAQRLEFGAHKIYHRLEGSQVVFSVASMLKPGTLDPVQATGFSTPGLALFMVLPGPKEPGLALRDMLSTAQALAKILNAEVLDSQRKPMTVLSTRTLQSDVEGWARDHLSD